LYGGGVDTEPAIANDESSPTTSERRPWFVFAAMSLPLLALSVDINGIGTVLPSVQRELEVDSGNITWLASATSLTMAATLIIVGRVAPQLGNRRLVLAGAAIFGVASLACGVAPTFWSLIAARVGQGLGGVLMFTTSLAVINAVVVDRRRPAAVGAWGLVNGVGGALGPLVAGAATTVSWRAFFLASVPLCVIAFAVIVRLTPADPPRSVAGSAASTSLPTVRLALLGAALVALTWGFENTSEAGWTALPTEAAIGGALAVFAGLIVAHRAGRAAVLSATVRRSPMLVPANIVAFTANWGFGIAIVGGGLYLQFTMGLSPLTSGLVFSAFSAACAIAGVCISGIHRRLGSARAMAAAMMVVAASFAFGALVLHESTTMAVVAVVLIVAGFGQGLAFDLSTLAALEGVPDRDGTEAAGVISVVRSTGFTIGVALSTTLGLAVDAGSSPTSVADGVRSAFALAGAVAVLGIGGALVRRSTVTP
jgi:MFS family permease